MLEQASALKKKKMKSVSQGGSTGFPERCCSRSWQHTKFHSNRQKNIARKKEQKFLLSRVKVTVNEGKSHSHRH